jgi:HSP20 family protein
MRHADHVSEINQGDNNMNLLRYSPTRSQLPSFNHGSLLDELDRLFEAGFPAFREQARFGAFPVDVYQDKEAVTVRAELPGFRKEDLQVNVADDVLTISSRVTTGDEKETPGTSIERAVALPENLDYRKIAAAYENGVLTVTLPRRAEAKPASIAIEVK